MDSRRCLQKGMGIIIQIWTCHNKHSLTDMGEKKTDILGLALDLLDLGQKETPLRNN